MFTLLPPHEGVRRSFDEGALNERCLAKDPVLSRWARARDLRRAPRAPDAHARASAISPAYASELLERLDPDAALHGHAVVLADGDGVVLAARGLEVLEDAFLRTALVEGRRLGEAESGTNAVGTALAEQSAIAVIGAAHYEAAFAGLSCYAAPIRDASGRTVAVIDISAPLELAQPLHGVLVESFAAAIEAMLRARSVDAARIEATFIHFLDALPIATWLADADGRIRLANAAARALWGGEIHVPLEEYDRFKAWWPDGRRLRADEWGLPRALKSGRVVVDDEVNTHAAEAGRDDARPLRRCRRARRARTAPGDRGGGVDPRSR
jgi:transcriptional regulator of acetoin/glycerol metabolism